MFVKIKSGRLRELSPREQQLLAEQRRYYAEDVGAGVVIPLTDRDGTLEIYIENFRLQRYNENCTHRPLKEYIYPSRYVFTGY
jgi:hypothetical protein